jgi:hypothetical protein
VEVGRFSTRSMTSFGISSKTLRSIPGGTAEATRRARRPIRNNWRLSTRICFASPSPVPEASSGG